jgi:hypothetical protein
MIQRLLTLLMTLLMALVLSTRAEAPRWPVAHGVAMWPGA